MIGDVGEREGEPALARRADDELEVGGRRGDRMRGLGRRRRLVDRILDGLDRLGGHRGVAQRERRLVDDGVRHVELRHRELAALEDDHIVGAHAGGDPDRDGRRARRRHGDLDALLDQRAIAVERDLLVDARRRRGARARTAAEPDQPDEPEPREPERAQPHHHE